MRRVILESPYAGDISHNLRYARKAVRHSLSVGEAPIASHLLYTQRGVLEDADPDQRKHGIEAGWAWADVAEAAVFYCDLGLSPGMKLALDRYVAAGVPVEMRYLNQRGGAKSGQRGPIQKSPGGTPAKPEGPLSGVFPRPPSA